MKSRIFEPHYRTLLAHVCLLTWLSTCLAVFLYISRVGFVQIVDITKWDSFLGMLSHIPPLQYSLRLLGALMGILFYSLACVSLGLSVLQKWEQTHPSKLALGITAFLVGEVLFSLISLSLISLYRLTPTFVTILVVVGFLIGLPALKRFSTGVAPAINVWATFETREKIILGFTVASLILSLSYSATRLGYDASAEYFSNAKIMSVSQSPIFLYFTDSFAVSSFHPGILFTMVMQLFGDQAARLLSWINGIIILLLGLLLGERLGLTIRAQLWFLTLMVSSTAFLDLFGDGKIELISTAPAVAVMYMILDSIDRPTKSTFTLIGFLAGFSIISRPYNIFLVTVFVALSIFSGTLIQFRAGMLKPKLFVHSVLWMLPPLLLLGVFHLFQNWVWLDSPIAPITYAMNFDSGRWQWQFNPEDLNLYRTLYPFTLTFMNSAQSMGNISPLFVGMLPFLGIQKIRANVQISFHLKWLLLVAMTTLLLWIFFFFTVVEIRYVLFLWIILFLAMAQVIESTIQHAEKSISFLISTLIVLFLTILLARSFLISVIAYFPGHDVQQLYCTDTNLCKYLETINQPAAAGDRVLVLHAYRYYLRPDLFACSSRATEYTSLVSLSKSNPSAFWREVHRQGYRYIMYEDHLSERGYSLGQLPRLGHVPDWLNLEVLYAAPNARQLIYRLDAVNPPDSPEISCEQNSEGLWILVHSTKSQP